MTTASSHGPFWLQRPSAEELRSVLRAQRDQPLSYAEVGATIGDLPAGYHHLERSVALGQAPGTFERACAGLRAWAPHAGAKVSLLPPTPAVTEGETLLGLFRAFPFHVTTACRVVWVVDEQTRFGFGYGTLPHHPEQGEEAFVVDADEDGMVRFAVRAFSRPGHALTRMGGPMTRLMQARVTRRYLGSLKSFVAAG